MFKKFAVLCVLVCMGLTLAGCGGGSGKSEMPKDKVEPPKEAPAAAPAQSIEAPTE